MDGGLTACSPWCKESDTTEQLANTSKPGTASVPHSLLGPWVSPALLTPILTLVLPVLSPCPLSSPASLLDTVLPPLAPGSVPFTAALGPGVAPLT